MTDPQRRDRRRRPGRPVPDRQQFPGHVVIDINEVYAVLLEVRDTVADLAAGQEASTKAIADLREATAKEIADLKAENGKLRERVSKLEEWRWKAAGAAGAVGGGIAALITRIVGLDA